MKRLLVAVLLLAVGFVGGRATQPAQHVVPVAESAKSPTIAAPDRACRNDLASAKTQLAICRAYRGLPEEEADASPPTAPKVEMDQETRELLRTGKTNTSTVLVRTDCGTRFYTPGTWPPPGGPPP